MHSKNYLTMHPFLINFSSLLLVYVLTYSNLFFKHKMEMDIMKNHEVRMINQHKAHQSALPIRLRFPEQSLPNRRCRHSVCSPYHRCRKKLSVFRGYHS